MPQLPTPIQSRRTWPDDAEELFEPTPGARDQFPMTTTQTTVPPIPRSASVQQQPRTKRPVAPGAPLASPISRHLSPALLWGVLGFASGIVFWHVIGFWGFVSEVVLPAAPASRAASSLPHAPVTQPTSHLPARFARPRITKAAPGVVSANVDTLTITVSDSPSTGIAPSAATGDRE